MVFRKNPKNGIPVHFRLVPLNFWKIQRKMHVKIISILLTFFIFVTVGGTGADNVKSKQNTPNQATIMKADENTVAVLKRKEPPSEPATPLKKLKARLQSTISYPVTDYGAIMGTAVLGANFLKALEERRKLRSTDSLHKVIYSFESFQDPWKDKFSTSREITQSNSPNSNFGQPILKLYLNPDRDKCFEEGKIRSTLKLLQLKREEIFNEIFMGFRFSFGPKITPMVVEMNISPSPEKGPGLIIAF